MATVGGTQAVAISQCPQQLLRNFPAFQAHDVVLHIVPGEQIHAAVPEDGFVNHRKMLAIVLGETDFAASCAQGFQQGQAVFVLARVVPVEPSGPRNRNRSGGPAAL